MDGVLAVCSLKIADIFFSVWPGVSLSSMEMVDFGFNVVLYSSLSGDGCSEFANEFPCCKGTEDHESIL
jgi:hypothetical protein